MSQPDVAAGVATGSQPESQSDVAAGCRMSQPEVASGSQPEVASESQLESQLELLLSQEESPESRHLKLLNRQEMKMWPVVKNVFRVWKSHTTLQRLMKDGIIAAYATVQVEMPCGVSRAFLPEAQHISFV